MVWVQNCWEKRYRMLSKSSTYSVSTSTKNGNVQLEKLVLHALTCACTTRNLSSLFLWVFLRISFSQVCRILRVSQGEENRGCGCADNISRSKKKDKDKTSNNDSTHKSKVKKSKLTQVASSGTSTLNNSELDIISQSGPRSDRVTNGN